MPEHDETLLEVLERIGDRNGRSMETLREQLDRTEKEALIKALERTRGIRVEAARLLGISPRALFYKLRKHKINKVRKVKRRTAKRPLRS